MDVPSELAERAVSVFLEVFLSKFFRPILAKTCIVVRICFVILLQRANNGHRTACEDFMLVIRGKCVL